MRSIIPICCVRASGRFAMVVLVVVFATTGCVREIHIEGGPQAYYQTAFPRSDAARQLEEILESVARITVSSVYRTYVFAEESAPLASDPLDDSLLARAVDTVTVDRSRAATAVLLSESDGNLLLLTASHAVHSPDTVLQHYGPARPPSPEAAALQRVRSISILVQRTNWLVGQPDLTTFEVLARDELNDLAFLGARIPAHADWSEIHPLPVSMGQSERLSWGSFVYVLGFPAGYPMVTRGIVSDPLGEASRSFVVDGLWNEGMSGGLILALRGEGEELEWVGMARAAAAQTEHRLAPAEGIEAELQPWMPYEGPLFLEEVRRIQYGITLSVPTSVIRSFSSQHRPVLEAQEYRVPRF